jgi:DNA-binding response OmpR family regulator
MKTSAQVEQYRRNKQTDYHWGKLRLDTAARRAYVDDKDIMLKVKEFSVLEILAKNAGQFIPSELLYKTSWAMDYNGDFNTLWATMSGLRAKLGNHADLRIESERNRGYRLIVKRTD